MLMKSGYESPVFESDVVTKKGKMSAESGAVGSGKNLERKKVQIDKKVKHFPFELFSSIFLFMWKQRCYNNVRPLTLKLKE